MQNRNRPTCVLCRIEREQQPRPVRIGVWTCKRHWRLIVKLVRWHPASFGEQADILDLVELIAKAAE